jgi:hypothetical protein
VSLSEEEMLKRLRLTLMKRGKLSPKIIDETIGLPCKTIYMQRFGSLRETYRLIGYTSKRDCDYIESRRGWAAVNAKLAAELLAEITKLGGSAAPEADCVRLNESVSVSFRVARWCHDKLVSHAPYWSIHHTAKLAPGWVVAIRLGVRNKALLDYVLLPTTTFTWKAVRFSEKARERRGIERFQSFPRLVRSLLHRFEHTRLASPKAAAASTGRTPRKLSATEEASSGCEGEKATASAASKELK